MCVCVCVCVCVGVAYMWSGRQSKKHLEQETALFTFTSILIFHLFTFGASLCMVIVFLHLIVFLSVSFYHFL